MKITSTISAISLGLALSAPAFATGPITVYEQGSVGFSYSQFPIGPYSGNFYSEGSVLDPGAFPAGGTGASMGIRAVVDGVHYFVVFGGTRNVDNTGDVAFLFIRSNTSLAPGNYPVNMANYTTLFGFVDDGADFEIPASPDQMNWQAWVDGLVADHKLVSLSGAIQLTTVTDTLIEGTFSGTMMEFGGGVVVSATNGSFSLDPQPLAVGDSSWGSIKSLYR